MPRRISAEEAQRLGAVPVEAPRRKMSAADAAKLGGVPVETPAAEPATFSPESQSGAAMNGMAQGGTLGFADELQGAAGAFDEFAARLSPFEARNVDQTRPSQSMWEALRGRYREDRDASRKDDKTSETAHPVIHGAAELAGGLAIPIPGGAAKGLGAKMARGALTAGALGTAIGAGKSEDESAGGVARDALVNGLVAAPIGAAAGAAEHGLGKLAERFKGKAGQIRAEDDARIAAAVEKERQSLQGTARSANQSASRDGEVLFRQGDPRSLPVQAKVNQFIDSPAAQELADSVALGKLQSAPDRIAEQKAAWAAHDAFAADAPNEVGKRIALRESKGIRSEALPRIKTYLTRLVPPVAGSAIGAAVSDDKATGGMVGAAAGGVIAASLGAPGTAFANMMKSPAFRIAFAEMRQGASNSLSRALGKFAPIVAAQTSEAGIESALKKIAEADPETAAKAQAALEANQSKPESLARRFGGQ